MMKYTIDEWRKMLTEAVEKGLTRRDISGKYDISVAQITHMCKALDIQLPWSKKNQHHGRKVSVSEHEEIRRDYAGGMSMAQIGKKYNLSTTAVWNHVNMKHDKLFTVERMQQRMDRYNAGMTAKQIAEAEGVDVTAIWVWLSNHGLRTNPVKRE